jgi:murein DD-endopeptidase MepM/ murein hydrolase activator NlpD
MGRSRIDGMVVVSMLFLSLIIFNIWHDRATSSDQDSSLGDDATLEEASAGIGFNPSERGSIPVEQAAPAEPVSVKEFDQDAISMPYEDYGVTQGPHGAEYGHLAIDITAGKGAEIHSPINGVVMAVYSDPVGSTILIIENERWQVTLVHGLFSVSIGDFLQLGQVIGEESNQGNTVDMQGRSCRGRDCGYHTHINIYDKKIGANINPLQIFP